MFDFYASKRKMMRESHKKAKPTMFMTEPDFNRFCFDFNIVPGKLGFGLLCVTIHGYFELTTFLFMNHQCHMIRSPEQTRGEKNFQPSADSAQQWPFLGE